MSSPSPSSNSPRAPGGTGTRGRAPRAPRIADLLLGAAIVVVPLAFTTAVRDFAPFKAGLLEILVGAAAVFAAFDGSAPRAVGKWAEVALGGTAAYAGALTLGRPAPDAVAAGAWVVACAGLVYLVATRATAWRPGVLLACVAAPWTIDVALSAAQAAGAGVLPATAASFGGTHGVLVGTVGNPNENAWYVLLGGVLVLGLWPEGWPRGRGPRWRWAMQGAVVAAVLGVIALDRARAAMAAAVVAAGVAVAMAIVARLRRRGSDEAEARRWIVPAAVLSVLALGAGASVAIARWGGGKALAGRLYLARIAASMVVERRGLPAGPGELARAFPDAQARWLSARPEAREWYSEIDHAHVDPLEVAHDLGLPGLLMVLVPLGLAARRWAARARAGERGGVAGLAGLGAAGLLAGTGYPMFSPAGALVVCLLVGTGLETPAPPPGSGNRRAPPGPAPRSIRAVLLLAGGVALLLAALPAIWAELRITAALKAHARGEGREALLLARAAHETRATADVDFFLGNLELVHGRPGAAAKAYEDSFAARPRPETAGNLAIAYRALGMADLAARWEAEARRLRPVGE